MEQHKKINGIGRSKTTIDLSIKDFTSSESVSKIPFVDVVLYKFNEPIAMFRIIKTGFCCDQLCMYVRDGNIVIIEDTLANNYDKNKLYKLIGVNFENCTKRLIILNHDMVIAKINGDMLNKTTVLKCKNGYKWIMNPNKELCEHLYKLERANSLFERSLSSLGMSL